jgi:hypothetical protein
MATHMILRLALAAILGTWAASPGAARGQINIPLPQYHIYAGNTHSHTTNTWSHGEHLGAAAAEPGAGKQKAARFKVLKPDWQEHQGPPAAHYALAKSMG